MRAAMVCILSRVVLLLGCSGSIVVFYLALFGGIASAHTVRRHELPMRAVVQGHNVQPRGDQLKSLGYSDLTPQ